MKSKHTLTPEEQALKSDKRRSNIYAMFAALLALFSSLVHIVNSLDPFVAKLLPTIGVLVLATNAFLWQSLPKYRRFIRGLYLAVPAVALLFGILMAIVFFKDNRHSTFWYMLATYGTLVLMLVQAFFAYMLPSLAVTVRAKCRFDLVMFPAVSLANALMITYFALFAIPQGYIYVEYEPTTLLLTYALSAWVYTAFSIFPLFKSLRGKTEE